MRLRRILLACLVMLFCLSSAVLAKENGQEPLLKVGLAVRQSHVKVSADADFFMTAGNTTVMQIRANENVTVSSSAGRLTVNGTPVTGSFVRLSFAALPKRGHGNAEEQAAAAADKMNRLGYFVQVNGKRYRGHLEFRQHAGSSTLSVSNIVPLEAYLYGVVPQEISPAWNLEAVKAQAVAARSYAFASVGKHQDQGVDVCTTVHCQVYGGYDSEAARSNQAVDATRGIMVTYKGAVIPAFFHSSSGGHTENSENVWGTPQPYLKGVADFDQKSPRFVWQRRVSTAKLTELLATSGYQLGSLTAVELSPLTRQPVKAADRGISGRVRVIKLIGTKGTVELSGQRFSSLFGLPSSLFDISVAKSVGEAVSAYAVKPSYRRIIHDTANDVLVINGSGAGHGIGLSQWGAKAMADQARPGNLMFYQQILSHYYTGVDVKKWYK